MAEIGISGNMLVRTLKNQFKEAFNGLTLRVYRGNAFADEAATLASIRKLGKPEDGKQKYGDFKVHGNLTIGVFEEKMKEVYGITVGVANADNTKLLKHELSLSEAARQHGNPA